MSEASKAARAAMKAKIDRLVRADPKMRVDASGYTPPDALDTDVKTGARPVSDRLYGGYPGEKRAARRKGGKVYQVPGTDAERNLGKSTRKGRDTGGGLGGLLSHNKDLMGGGALGALGLKTGGKAKRASGGGVTDPDFDVRKANEKRAGTKHIGAFKDGGKVHDDVEQDEKLIHQEVKASALKRKSGGKAMNVNIIIGEKKPAAPEGPPPGLDGGMPPPPMPPKPMGPPPGAGGPPPMMGPGGPPPPTMGPPGPPPPMGRKAGGRTQGAMYTDFHAAGGALGRLEKIEAYGNQDKK